MGTITINLNSPLMVTVLVGMLGSIGAFIVRMVVFLVRIGPKHKVFTSRLNKNAIAIEENKTAIDDFKEVFNEYVNKKSDEYHKDSMKVQKEMGDIKVILGKMDGKMEMLINKGQ